MWYEESIGDFLGRLPGSLHRCWRVKGPVSEIFKKIYPSILSLHKEFQDSLPRTEDVVLGCYMIGLRPNRAKPFIAFASIDQRPRKALRDLVERERILAEYIEFKLIDWSQDPGSRNMMHRENEREPSNTNTEGALEDELRIDGLNPGLHGAIILRRQNIGTDKSWEHIGTGGGIVTKEDGTCYVMTAAHPFLDYAGPLLPPQQGVEEFEFSADDLSEDEEFDEFGIEGTSQGSLTPPTAQNSSSDDMSSDSNKDIYLFTPFPHLATKNADSEPGQPRGLPTVPGSSKQQMQETPTQREPTEPETIYTQRPYISSSKGSQPGLDYALIELPNYCLDYAEAESPRGIKHSYPLSMIPREPSSRVVTVVTASHGLTRGQLLETPTFLLSPPPMGQQELWTVTLESETGGGDSGSWIIDANSGALIGHIIAASTDSGATLIIPAFQILEDLQRRFGVSWVPVINDDGGLRILLSSRSPQQVTALSMHNQLPEQLKLPMERIVNIEIQLQAEYVKSYEAKAKYDDLRRHQYAANMMPSNPIAHVDLKSVHGRLSYGGPPATLALLTFSFSKLDVGHQSRLTGVNIRFKGRRLPLAGRDSETPLRIFSQDPEVRSIWPNGDFNFNKSEAIPNDKATGKMRSSSRQQPSGSWEWSTQSSSTDFAHLRGMKMIEARDFGVENAVQFTLEERPRQADENISHFSTAILLGRQNDADCLNTFVNVQVISAMSSFHINMTGATQVDDPLVIDPKSASTISVKDEMNLGSVDLKALCDAHSATIFPDQADNTPKVENFP